MQQLSACDSLVCWHLHKMSLRQRWHLKVNEHIVHEKLQPDWCRFITGVVVTRGSIFVKTMKWLLGTFVNRPYLYRLGVTLIIISQLQYQFVVDFVSTCLWSTFKCSTCSKLKSTWQILNIFSSYPQQVVYPPLFLLQVRVFVLLQCCQFQQRQFWLGKDNNKPKVNILFHWNDADTLWTSQ